MFRKVWTFAKNVAVSTFNTVVEVFKDLTRNVEACVILITSTVGVTAILSEIPFHMTMPMWIESAMIMPIISTLIIVGLLISMEFRCQHAE